jgi:NitT/TauT family transport system permease protein
MMEDRAPAVTAARSLDSSSLWTTLRSSHLVVVLPVATAFLFLLAWQAIAIYGEISPAILPPPTMVIEQLTSNFPLIMRHTIPTTYETLLAFGISIPLGIALAGLMVYSTAAYRALYPNIVFFQLIPKIALAPLFIVWFGFGVAPKVAVAFLIAFFPIVIDTIVGLRSIDPAMLQLARSMGAPPHRIFLKMRLPHALPAIFGGLKVASSLAVVGALTGEFVGSDKGLGYMLVQASGNLNTALLFATLVVLSALAMAFFYLIEVVERIAIPWHASQRAHPH